LIQKVCHLGSSFSLLLNYPTPKPGHLCLHFPSPHFSRLVCSKNSNICSWSRQ
jgi:hypothetical protein